MAEVENRMIALTVEKGLFPLIKKLSLDKIYKEKKPPFLKEIISGYYWYNKTDADFPKTFLNLKYF